MALYAQGKGEGAKMWHLHNRCEPRTVDCHRAHGETRNTFVQKLVCYPNIKVSPKIYTEVPKEWFKKEVEVLIYTIIN